VSERPSGGPAFYDVLTHQRACRSFLPDPVGDDTIDRILTAATYAPSAENTQPWRFIVVRDPEKRRAIAELATRIWEGGARQVAKEHLNDRILADVDQSTSGGGIANAPIIIVVCADTSDCFPSALAASMWPAVQNLLLAAHSEGIGTALTTMAALLPDALRTLLSIPENIEPYAVIPLGYPSRRLGPPNRRELGAVRHVDRWPRD
jgi:nitroreductase